MNNCYGTCLCKVDHSKSVDDVNAQIQGVQIENSGNATLATENVQTPNLLNIDDCLQARIPTDSFQDQIVDFIGFGSQGGRESFTEIGVNLDPQDTDTEIEAGGGDVTPEQINPRASTPRVSPSQASVSNAPNGSRETNKNPEVVLDTTSKNSSGTLRKPRATRSGKPLSPDKQVLRSRKKKVKTIIEDLQERITPKNSPERSIKPPPKGERNRESWITDQDPLLDGLVESLNNLLDVKEDTNPLTAIKIKSDPLSTSRISLLVSETENELASLSEGELPESEVDEDNRFEPLIGVIMAKAMQTKDLILAQWGEAERDLAAANAKIQLCVDNLAIQTVGGLTQPKARLKGISNELERLMEDLTEDLEAERVNGEAASEVNFDQTQRKVRRFQRDLEVAEQTLQGYIEDKQQSAMRVAGANLRRDIIDIGPQPLPEFDGKGDYIRFKTNWQTYVANSSVPAAGRGMVLLNSLKGKARDEINEDCIDTTNVAEIWQVLDSVFEHSWRKTERIIQQNMPKPVPTEWSEEAAYKLWTEVKIGIEAAKKQAITLEHVKIHEFLATIPTQMCKDLQKTLHAEQENWKWTTEMVTKEMGLMQARSACAKKNRQTMTTALKATGVQQQQKWNQKSFTTKPDHGATAVVTNNQPEGTGEKPKYQGTGSGQKFCRPCDKKHGPYREGCLMQKDIPSRRQAMIDQNKCRACGFEKEFHGVTCDKRRRCGLKTGNKCGPKRHAEYLCDGKPHPGSQWAHDPLAKR